MRIATAGAGYYATGTRPITRGPRAAPARASAANRAANRTFGGIVSVRAKPPRTSAAFTNRPSPAR